MIRLVLLGDVMLGRGVDAALEREPAEYPWGDTLAILRRADLRICNLECAISDRGLPWRDPPRAFHFRSAAKNVETLRRAGVNAVVLANNHVLDFGAEALEDTLALLDGADIARAGAGRNLAEAARVAVLESGGFRVGLLAFTDNEPAWAAAGGDPGVYHVEADAASASARGLLDRAAEAARRVDALVVSAHWGPNWGETPPMEHVALAHALLEAGARVVFGHSPHVLRAVEPGRGGVVLYSAGDFVDDYAVDPVERNDWSAIFEVDLDEHAVRVVRAVPTVIRGCRACVAHGPERDAIARKLARLCLERGSTTEWDEGAGALRVLSGAS
jgi:poly-gamma-glutamate synthesis protein (capsule biosynthesis protein)